MCLNLKINKCLSTNYNFYPIEVVGRGSETQLQVGENFIKLTLHNKGEKRLISITKKALAVLIGSLELCTALVMWATKI